MRLFDLSERIAIVTGGNQGIGFAIARGLATAGAKVVIANRRAVEGQMAAEYLTKEGLNAVAVPTDVSSLSSVAALVSKTVSEFGRIDILVNNAAVVVRKPAEEVSEEDWDYVMNINLKGLFFCCQIVGKEMIRRKKGKIINLSSISAQIVENKRSVYCVSKAGISHLTRTLAFEWAKYNINVNALAPGVIAVNDQYYEQHPDEMRDYISHIPKGKAGNPSDCVGAAIFLASDASDYVTGHILVADGGYVL